MARKPISNMGWSASIFRCPKCKAEGQLKRKGEIRDNRVHFLFSCASCGHPHDFDTFVKVSPASDATTELGAAAVPEEAVLPDAVYATPADVAAAAKQPQLQPIAGSPDSTPLDVTTGAPLLDVLPVKPVEQEEANGTEED